MPAPTKVTVARISFALIKYISHKPEATNSFRFVHLGYYTLAHPPKSEFVESERKLKSNRFRHFIHVNLGIVVKVYQNLPFTCKNA